jgi:branched-chain amino acid aminotransferase
MSAQTLSFQQIQSTQPRSDAERAEILREPVFGSEFTDHQVIIEWDKEQGWHSARVEAYGPMQIMPSAAVLHYGQEIFEGIKGYRHADGSIWTFRPLENAKRLRASARRMALPELPEELFVESLKQLIALDAAWVPQPEGEKTLYFRPFEIAAENFLGVRAAAKAEYRVIASPVGPYFKGGIKPLSIWIALGSSRAGKYGTGEAKTGGNYAASLLAQTEGYNNGCSQVMFLDAETSTYIEELGGMNLFFVRDDGTVVTPSLDGTILRGITRSSLIQLIQDRGIAITERKVSIAEVKAGMEDGSITEIFACGTAAVITPVAELRSRDGNVALRNQDLGTLTASLREELLGIQFGTKPDPHGWMVRLG